jgi:type IV secretion system protein TrbD
MRELRRVPIYRALHRPNLFAGGERRLSLTALLFCALIGISNLGSPLTWGIAVLVYSVTMFFLRKLAAKDPSFSYVFLRQISYQPYYPPRRGLDAPAPGSRLD